LYGQEILLYPGFPVGLARIRRAPPSGTATQGLAVTIDVQHFANRFANTGAEASYRGGRLGDRFVSGRLAPDRRSVISRLLP